MGTPRAKVYACTAPRAPVLTEPLAPQDWADFDQSIGNSPRTEPVLPHNPSWNLDLLRSIVKNRWKDLGKEGSPEPPGPIGTKSQRNIVADLVPMDIDNDTSPAPEMVKEGGRRRKAVNYKIPGPNFYLGGDDDDEGEIPVGRRRRRRNLDYGDDMVDSDHTPVSWNRKAQSIRSSPEKLGSSPVPPSTGRKRGRPRKIRIEDSQISTLESSTETGIMSSSTPLASNIDKYSMRNQMADRQNVRRKILILSVKKLHTVDWSKYDNPVPKAPAPLPEPIEIEPAIGSTVQTAELEIVDLDTPVQSEYDSESTVYASGPGSPSKEKPFPAGLLRIPNLDGRIRCIIPRKPEFFSRRKHISPVLGGDTRSMVVTVNTEQQSDCVIRTEGYVAASPLQYPHLPEIAGNNGAIIHLFADTLDSVADNCKSFPLFVCRAKSQWEYCGQYELYSKAELNPYDRWVNFNNKATVSVKSYWANVVATNRSQKQGRTNQLFMTKCGLSWEEWEAVDEDKIAVLLDQGKVAMNWIFLKCVGWEPSLYEALLKRKCEVPVRF